jgi:hypothetical protein
LLNLILASNEKRHHRSESAGTELDRPLGPPPVPPGYRQRYSNYDKGQIDNNVSPMLQTSNNDVPVGILTPNLNPQINTSNKNPSQTNNIHISSRHDNLPSSPGEITQF